MTTRKETSPTTPPTYEEAAFVSRFPQLSDTTNTLPPAPVQQVDDTALDDPVASPKKVSKLQRARDFVEPRATNLAHAALVGGLAAKEKLVETTKKGKEPATAQDMAVKVAKAALAGGVQAKKTYDERKAVEKREHENVEGAKKEKFWKRR